MNGKSGRRWIQLAVGGLWALALGAVLAPGQARAGCGDGLMPLGDGHHAAGKAVVRHGATDTPKPAPRPCSGPLCSRAPLAPSPMPLSSTPRTVDDLCTLTPLLLLPVPGPLAALAEDVPECPVRRSSDVYHPPR